MWLRGFLGRAKGAEKGGEVLMGREKRKQREAGTCWDEWAENQAWGRMGPAERKARPERTLQANQEKERRRARDRPEKGQDRKKRRVQRAGEVVRLDKEASEAWQRQAAPSGEQGRAGREDKFGKQRPRQGRSLKGWSRAARRSEAVR